MLSSVENCDYFFLFSLFYKHTKQRTLVSWKSAVTTADALHLQNLLEKSKITLAMMVLTLSYMYTSLDLDCGASAIMHFMMCIKVIVPQISHGVRFKNIQKT